MPPEALQWLNLENLGRMENFAYLDAEESQG
jgi:hypothetical protein